MTRGITKRDEDLRASTVYRPPSMLETPLPPAGYHYRWVRVSIRNEDDARNILDRRREGYEFVRREELPADYDCPVIQGGRFDGVVGVTDLVLAKIPLEMKEARDRYYQNETRRSTEWIETQMFNQQHPDARTYGGMENNSTTRVSRGTGRSGRFGQEAQAADPLGLNGEE